VRTCTPLHVSSTSAWSVTCRSDGRVTSQSSTHTWKTPCRMRARALRSCRRAGRGPRARNGEGPGRAVADVCRPRGGRPFGARRRRRDGRRPTAEQAGGDRGGPHRSRGGCSGARGAAARRRRNGARPVGLTRPNRCRRRAGRDGRCGRAATDGGDRVCGERVGDDSERHRLSGRSKLVDATQGSRAGKANRRGRRR
jgi:hypothetical protein